MDRNLKRLVSLRLDHFERQVLEELEQIDRPLSFGLDGSGVRKVTKRVGAYLIDFADLAVDEAGNIQGDVAGYRFASFHPYMDKAPLNSGTKQQWIRIRLLAV